MPGARITGVAELRVELEKVSQRFQRKVIQEASHVAALDLERHIVTALNQGPATGRVYTHYMFMKGGKLMQGRKRDTPHQASAKGEYPMTDMGVLASSISTDRRREGADVVARAPYAERLEFKDPARGGRPFMRRGLQENEGRIHQIVLWAARRILQRP